jgi:hypothetical protein
MRYVQPYGVSDPDAPYVNGDPTIGREGSIPPAAAIEHPMREVVAVIAKSGIRPNEEHLEQLAEGVRSQFLNFAEDTGTPDNLRVAYDPPITEYTRGLVLRVRVRHNNTGPCNINAGGDTVAVRKMNGADLSEGELSNGALITLVFDGTIFQLSNFGGAGGGEEQVFMVNIPYTVDTSPTPGRIIAVFNPPIEEDLVPGNVIAVRVAHTNPGATYIEINNLDPIQLMPNGGGIMLQGDIIADDVVQFFYDGEFLRFHAFPEITAPATYTVGTTGQNFPSIEAAMQALRRKIIGARGHVTLLMAPGAYDGGIEISHPNADRLVIRGTMIAAHPTWGEFAANGSSSQQRAQDAFYNINMLRGRYGTEIRLRQEASNFNTGIRNVGPGKPVFQDLLFVGTQTPMPSTWLFWEQGIHVPTGCSCWCYDCTVWGAQVGWAVNGSVDCYRCFAANNTFLGVTGNIINWGLGGVIGNQDGIFINYGGLYTQQTKVLVNGGQGIWCSNGGSAQNAWTDSLGNGTFDVLAFASSSINMVLPASFNNVDPPTFVVGNYNSIITQHYQQPPP